MANLLLGGVDQHETVEEDCRAGGGRSQDSSSCFSLFCGDIPSNVGPFWCQLLLDSPSGQTHWIVPSCLGTDPSGHSSPGSLFLPGFPSSPTVAVPSLAGFLQSWRSQWLPALANLWVALSFSLRLFSSSSPFITSPLDLNSLESELGLCFPDGS